MATERLILEFQTRGTRQVDRNISRIRKEASAANKTLALLRSTLVVVAGARVISRFLELSDVLTNIRNRLRLVTTSTEQLNAVQQRLFQISQQTRSSFESNAIFFNRLARSANGLGLTYNELLDITKGVTQAIGISGATSQEARNSLIQFAQGLAAGALRGDELRSVVEQLPRLADAIAAGFGVSAESTARSLGVTEEALKSAQKEVGNLTGGALVAFAKANEGILTTDKVIQALQSQLGVLDVEFSKIDITVGQAFEKFNNEIILFVGGITNSIQLGNKLDTVLTLVARNLDIIVVSLAAIAAIAAFNILTSQVLTFGTTLRNVLGFALGGFGALFRIVTGLFGVFRLLVPIGTVVAGIFSAGFLPALLVIGGIVLAFFALRAALQAVEERFGPFTTIFTDAFGALFGLIDGLVEAFSLLDNAVADIAISAANSLISGFQDGINGVIELLNAIPGVDITPADLELFENEFEGAAAQVREILARNIKEGVEGGFQSTDTFEGIENLIAQAKNLLSGGLLPDDFDDAKLKALLDQISGGTDGLADFNKEAGKAATSIRKIRAAVDPAEEAFKRINDAFEAFSKISKDNFQETEFARETLRLLAEDILDVVDTERQYEAMLNVVTEAQEKLGLSAERAALARKQLALAARQDLDSTLGGVFPLIRAEGELLQIEADLQRLQVNGQITAAQAADAQRRLAREAFGLGKTLQQTNEEISALEANQELLGLSTAELEHEVRQLNIAFLQTQRDAASGANLAFLRIIDDATNAAQFTEQIFTDAFDALGDKLVEFAETGKFTFDDFFRSIAAQLIKLGTQQAVAGFGGFFTNLLGGVGGFGGGGPSGSTLGGIGGLVSGLFGFQNGGSFTVGPNTAAAAIPGADNRLVAFRAKDGEEVQVNRPGQSSQRPINVNFTVNTPDADSFIRSRGQIEARLAATLQRASQRNN